MKRAILSMAVLAMALICNLMLSGCEKKTELAAELDQFMSAYNQNCSYKYNGAILVAQGDQVLLKQGYGTANYEKNIPNASDSVFAIGSITKSFTAVGILQLQENGLLKLEDPISKYIKGNPRGDEITIRQLLTHTSGMVRDGKVSGDQQVPLKENIDFINGRPLLFEPGEDFSYSNAGYNILAAIIEKASGKPYNTYINESILAPLGMNKSRCGVDASYADDQSIGYLVTTDSPTPLSIYNLSCVIGSGNIYSTVEDLYKYERGIYSGKLLNQESFDKMLSPSWGDWNSGYGYGWEITQRNGRKRLSHGGNIGGGGYVSLFVKYPEDDYTLIFLTNNADRTALDTVSQTMEAILFGEEYVIPEKTKAKVSDKTLKQYEGEYEFGEGFLISVSYKNGRLYSTADDGSTYELLPISKTSFHYEDHQWIKGEFIIDKEDNSITYRIQNINRIFEGKKVKD